MVSQKLSAEEIRKSVENGTWPPMDSDSIEVDARSCRVLNDIPWEGSKPGESLETEGLFEQKSVQHILTRAIEKSVSMMRKEKESTRIFALYGRFGQGKSRILKNIETHFQRHCIVDKRLQLPFHVRNFPVSNYLEKDLLDNFDYFVEYKRRLWLLGGFLLVLLAFLGVFSFVPGLIGTSNRFVISIIGLLLGALAGGAFGLVTSWRILWRDALRSFRLGRFREFSGDFFRSLIGSPELIIIDDLDRATIAQQKAILFSLRRHRDTLKSVILIAFDEEPLLNSMKDQTSPKELLTKTFDASFRLAPLNAQDAVDMAVLFSREIKKINPDCPYATWLNHPMVVGDLGRVFYLHGNASARFAKKLINNVYLETVRMGLGDAHDISALIRINGMFEYVPTMESDLDFIARNLMDGSDDKLIAVIEKRFGESLDPGRHAALLSYLEKTRHMLPRDGGWQRILRIQRPVSAPGENESLLLLNDELIEAWCKWDVILTSRHDANERRMHYLSVKNNRWVPPSDREFRVERISKKKPTDRRPTKADSGLWLSMANRLMAYDSDYINDLNWHEFLSFLGAFEKENAKDSPPLIIKKGDEGWGTPAQIVAHHRTFYSKGDMPTDILRHNLRHALPIDKAKFERELEPAEALDDNKWRGEHLLVSAINVAWPRFYEENVAGRLSATARSNFGSLNELLSLYTAGTPLFPNSHAYWVRRMADNGQFEAVLDALLLLLPPSFDIRTGRMWPHATVGKALELFHVQPGLLLEIIAEKIALTREPDPLFWMACIMFNEGNEKTRITATAALAAMQKRVNFPSLGSAKQLNLAWLKVLVAVARENDELKNKLIDWFDKEAGHQNKNTDWVVSVLSPVL